MANIWGIPDWLENKVRARDKRCVYCHVEMKEYPHTKGTPGDKATFEHIDNDGQPVEENIAMCCSSCNSSKLAKKLMDWLDSPYCKGKNITRENVAGIVKRYIEKNAL